jgi:hypothetical protein
MAKNKIIKPYTESHIDEHAGKVGGRRNLREVIIHTDDDCSFHYLIKKPSKGVLQAVADYEAKKDIAGIQKVMMGCVLEGDKEAIEHDGAIYTDLLSKISELINSTKSEIKKL